MTPWVINLGLAAVLIYLLFDRRTRRWSVVARQGLGFDDGVSVLGGFRVAEGDHEDSWTQGTITRDRAGDYLWTPGGSVTAQRLGAVHVVDARVCSWWEGVWSLRSGWVVMRCAGIEGTGGAAFEIAAGPDDLGRLPELARHAAPR
jgi:hypothetical protein